MRKNIIIFYHLIFILLITKVNGLQAQGSISGYVFDAQTSEALPGVNIILKKTAIGAATDQNGYFEISNVPDGVYLLSVQMVGYQTIKRNVRVNHKKSIRLSFKLKPEILKGDAIVVTGTRAPRYLKDSPVRTDVVTYKELERRNPANFLEATQSVVGIDPSIECSICNASSISLQGLPGRYTQVLIDGIPLFSSLGQTYGYLELPANLIDQLEIIKGANSVLYGSDAIAGIVNIRTREPSFVPKMNLETQIGQYGEKKINGSASFKPGGVGVLISGEFYNMKPVDRDGDGITEFSGTTRSFLNGKMTFQMTPRTYFNIRVSGLAEERQGGSVSSNHSFIETLDSHFFRIFSESILSKRFDAVSEIKHNFSSNSRLTFKSSYTSHFQDSDYEGFVYVANQNLSYNEIQFDHSFNTKLDIISGISYRTEKLAENTAIHPYNYKTSSLFLQLDYHLFSKSEVLGGIRYDHHNIFGEIITPSFVFKQPLNAAWTFRFAYGQGFRAPTTFFELDHGTGAKYKYHTRYLANKAERSGSFNISLDFNRHNQSFSIAPFYHRINNYITAYNDYKTKSFVVENIEAPSSIYGVEINYNNKFFNCIYLTLGHIFERYQLANGVLGHARPQHKFKWSLNYDEKSYGFSLNLDGQVTGPMKLRKVYGIAYNKDGSLKQKTSPAFAVVNAEIARTFGSSIRFAIGAKNLFDFQQNDVESPLMYDKDGNLGDVIYIWGPLLGRTIYGRCSINLN